MDALDLTLRPPRGPRVLLPNLELVMMARTVDKLRATLPGGKLGSYKIPGLSTRLLEALGIAENALREVVAGASSDQEVVAWIRSHSEPTRYPAVNAALEKRKVQDRLDDPEFLAQYPLAKSLPPETPLLDSLAVDDRAMFPSSS